MDFEKSLEGLTMSVKKSMDSIYLTSIILAIPRGHHLPMAHEWANMEIVLSPGNRKTSPDASGRFVL